MNATVRVADIGEALPQLRGRLMANAPLADITWFRVGGPADHLFTPADEDDLAYFLKNTPLDIAVTVIGLGSNLLVRDGGICGVVIRLGRGFSALEVEQGFRLRAGAAVPDIKVARAAADASIKGFAFFRGIPGSVGGALAMNGGAHGCETKDVLVEARAVYRNGGTHTFLRDDMAMSYRHCGVRGDLIFTQALFQGVPGDQQEIKSEMEAIAEYRQEAQPIKSRTGGSTFKNPNGRKAWQLIDEAGCRGLRVGGACVSQKHCNFLINEGGASAEDLETLGETVRARVRETSGIELEWEIKRLGQPASGADRDSRS